jgi:hypothetical protein
MLKAQAMNVSEISIIRRILFFGKAMLLFSDDMSI